MTIAELGALGEFIGSLAVVVTVGYLALQIRQSTAQQRREESLSIQQGQNSVISQYLNHFQNVYDLHHNGSLDEERYALWEGFAVGMVG